MSKPKYFVALHIGAGYHSPLKEEEYARLCRQACNIATKLLKQTEEDGQQSGDKTTTNETTSKTITCVEVVQKVCCFLEDSPLTNAGYGSNLSLNGLVECDAGIMESSKGAFGAVTCVQGVRNPIQLARILLDEQLLSTSKLVPPLVLAGKGAQSKAVSYGLELLEKGTLASPQALSDHKRYKRLLDGNNEEETNPSCKKLKLGSSSSDETELGGNSSIHETELGENASTHETELGGNSSIHEMESRSECYQNTKNTNVENKDLEKRDSKDISSHVDTIPDQMIKENGCKVKTDYGCSTLKTESLLNQADKKEPSVFPVLNDDRQTDVDNDIRSHLQDTIGVICIDNNLNIASGVSSGGIVLKHPGRVSHAAHYGCGCWAFRYTDEYSVGSCTSGCGELLIRTNFAKKAAEHSLRKTHKVLNYNKFVEDKFLNSPYIAGMLGQRYCGLLVAKLFKDKQDKPLIDFQLAHTSESFCVCFVSSDMKKPQFLLSRLPREKAGKSVLSQGFTLKL